MSAQEKPGLQAERTLLSWERTAIGFLVGGALPLFHQHGPLEFGREPLATVAVLLAIVAMTLGWQRARSLRAAAGQPTIPAGRCAVFALGAAVTVFALVATLLTAVHLAGLL